MSTLPVETPQPHHLRSHLTVQWCSLSQLQHIHQEPLPVEIRYQSHQKQTQKEFTQTISPKQDTSVLPSKIALATTSTTCVFLSAITHTGRSNISSNDSQTILLSTVPYVTPSHSPSVPYLLPSLIKDTVFSTSNLSSISPLKEIYENTSSDILSPPRLSPSSNKTTFVHNPKDYYLNQDYAQKKHLYHY